MSVVVEQIRTMSELRRFIELPKRLYASTPQWVPLFDADYRGFFRNRHPFFRHARCGFLLARADHDPAAPPLGRVLMIENARYNAQHGRRAAHFYFLDFADDPEIADALFEAMARWADARGLDELLGPLFTGASLGGGLLVKGFEHAAAMTMMPYNHAYYVDHYERAGFLKHFDLYSLFIDPRSYELPEKVERLAELARRRGRMKVLEFTSKAQLRRAARRVAALYNPTLADHTENYPLTDEELERIIKDLLQLARPDLEKVITYDGEVVGYMLGFPDVTAALRSSGGRLTPASILRIMHEARHARRLILNGMGILERYQRIGGNALIYSELARTVKHTPSYRFDEAEMVQINEGTDLMLADLRKLGAQVGKVHRVYRASIGSR